MNYDIVVLGSGPGGYVAAVRAAQLGYKTAVIEKENLGGVCLNWGCIPTKALLKSAQVYNYIKHAEAYGIELKEAPVANMEAIVSRSRTVASTMSKGVEFLMKKNSIDVIKGFGKLSSAGIIEVTDENGDKQQLEAQHIILASGARSRQLPNLPQDGKHIIGYREAMTMTKQPGSMLVVGSGAIGSEFAHFYQSIGTQVYLVEFMPTIVPNEDSEVASTLQRCMKKNGMKVYTSSSVDKVEVTAQDKCLVTMTTKKGQEQLEVDVVLSAVGVATNIEGIGLQEIGIKTEKGKVIVDDYYATNVKGVYAIGDIVHGPALAHVASKEAIVCVEAIKGLPVQPVSYDNVPGCTYTSPEIASVGLSEDKAKAQGIDILIGKTMYMASGKATAAGARDGFVKVIIDKQTDQILGCSMIGDNVTEMIEEIVVARENKLTAHQILNAIHPHPTMSEAVMEALEAAYSKAIHA